MSRYRRLKRLELPVLDKERELEEIYREIPKIECKKLCADSCGPIAIAPLERKRLEEVTGKEVYANYANMTCSLLEGGLCSGYDKRPLLCRLWGVVREMACPFGCVPERYLSDEEAYKLFLRLERIAGQIPKSVDVSDEGTGVTIPHSEVRSAQNKMLLEGGL